MFQTLKYVGCAGVFLFSAEVWVVHARLLTLIGARRRRKNISRTL